MALQHAASNSLPSTAALLAATSGWPMQQAEALALAVQGAGPLAAGFHSMLLPDAATVQAAVQAASMQQQLALLQATADTTRLLGAADSSAGFLGSAVRQPLHPLSLNLGGFGHAQLEPHGTAAACFGGAF